MTQERKAVLYIVKDERNKVAIKTEVRLREQDAKVNDLKVVGFATLFDASKYVKDKEEVTCIKPNKEITDDTLISEERSFAYHLYVTEK